MSFYLTEIRCRECSALLGVLRLGAWLNADGKSQRPRAVCPDCLPRRKTMYTFERGARYPHRVEEYVFEKGEWRNADGVVVTAPTWGEG